MIRRRDPGHFGSHIIPTTNIIVLTHPLSPDALAGPVILSIALFVAVLANFVIRGTHVVHIAKRNTSVNQMLLLFHHPDRISLQTFVRACAVQELLVLGATSFSFDNAFSLDFFFVIYVQAKERHPYPWHRCIGVPTGEHTIQEHE